VTVIGSVVLAEKRIYLDVGVRSFHPVDDLYKELRTLRHTDESLRHFEMPLTASGNVAKGGGKFTPRLVIFNEGWRVVPEDTSHTLDVTGEQITDDGQSGPACFDFTPLGATTKVIVNYQPPEAEVITVDTGGSFLGSDRTSLQNAEGSSASAAAQATTAAAEAAQAASDAAAAAASAAQAIADIAALEQFLPADRTALDFVYARRRNRWRIDPNLKKAYLYAADNVTVIASYTLVTQGGGPVVVPAGAVIDMIPDP
jgi:hypothetical protein